jgi:hypothetical protein
LAGERLDGEIGIAALHVGEPQRVGGVVAFGIEPQRLLERCNRTIDIASFAERDPEILVRSRQGRCKPRALSQLRDCAVEIAELAQRETQIVMGIRLLRIEPHSGFECGSGQFRLIDPPARGSQVILRVEQGGIQRGRAFERGDCVVGAPLLAEDESEAIVCSGHRRGQLDGPPVFALRRGWVLPLLVDRAQVVVRCRERGIAMRCVVKPSRRIVNALRFEQRDTLGHELLRR